MELVELSRKLLKAGQRQQLSQHSEAELHAVYLKRLAATRDDERG